MAGWKNLQDHGAIGKYIVNDSEELRNFVNLEAPGHSKLGEPIGTWSVSQKVGSLNHCIYHPFESSDKCSVIDEHPVKHVIVRRLGRVWYQMLSFSIVAPMQFYVSKAKLPVISAHTLWLFEFFPSLTCPSSWKCLELTENIGTKVDEIAWKTLHMHKW